MIATGTRDTLAIIASRNRDTPRNRHQNDVHQNVLQQRIKMVQIHSWHCIDKCSGHITSMHNDHFCHFVRSALTSSCCY